jgi:GNAT superfamily N-acetyltransferase
MNDLNVVIKRLENIEDAQRAYCCMTEVPTPWPGSLNMCREWIAQALGRYVEGYHLQLENGDVIGHLYYAPSAQALIPYNVEDGVGVLYCEWIQRRYQGQGHAKRLFSAFLEDLREEKAKGVFVEASDEQGQRHSGSYIARGFELLQEFGHRKLLYLPLEQAQISVQVLVPEVKPRTGKPVEIMILAGYMCPHEASTHLLLREVAREFVEDVVLREAWLTPDTLKEYGSSHGIFINGRKKLMGAETEAAVRQAIVEEF